MKNHNIPITKTPYFFAPDYYKGNIVLGSTFVDTQSNFSIVTSRKDHRIIQRTKYRKERNMNNLLIYYLSCSGSGFAKNLFDFFDYPMFSTLMGVSNELYKITTNYTHHNMLSDDTNIYNLESFLKIFWQPQIICCSYYYMPIHLNQLNWYNVNTLCISGTHLTDVDPIVFKNVKIIIMNDCTGVTDRHFEHMYGVVQLEIDYLYNPRITDEALAYLPGIKRLSMKKLQADISPIGFSFLGGIERLMLDSFHVTDEHLQYLDGIKELDLTNCTGFGDNGIRSITKSGKLQTLDLSYCCYDNHMTPAVQEHLKQIPELDMEGCTVSMLYEECPVCSRMRRIDMIQHHLDQGCDMKCTICDTMVRIGCMKEHLSHHCTKNFIKCCDCNIMYLQKNNSKHKRRCLDRLYYCNVMGHITTVRKYRLTLKKDNTLKKRCQHESLALYKELTEKRRDNKKHIVALKLKLDGPDESDMRQLIRKSKSQIFATYECLDNMLLQKKYTRRPSKLEAMKKKILFKKQCLAVGLAKQILIMQQRYIYDLEQQHADELDSSDNVINLWESDFHEDFD